VEQEQHRGDHPLFGKTARALLVMVALLAVPYASPKLARFRVYGAPAETEAVATAADPAAVAAAVTPATGELALHATSNEGTVTNALPATASTTTTTSALAEEADAKPQPIDDPSGHALDAFYASLARTDHKEAGAVTRILHYGDSVITGDLVSGTVRRRMQARFGDAGHGFILTANPWEWYFHNDVAHSASDGWSISRITGPWNEDDMYGVGGVSFHARGAASAWFSTATKGDYGRRVSRFDVYYLAQPHGGDVDLVVDGKKVDSVSTKADAKESRVATVHVPDGAAQLSVRARGNGDVRVFGVALERDVPGVVYDALGANGARARLWEQQSAQHWADQMGLRKPALIVLQYGTNESEDGVINPAVYEKQMGALVEKVKAAAPGASVLVAAPLDRAEKGQDGKLRSRKVMAQLVGWQRAVAREHKVGFFDTYAAMGGEGSFARWVKASPQLASWDLTHPTPAGAEVIGDLLYQALVDGYEASRKRD
jgi:lysophospholipase L1-like esterase